MRAIPLACLLIATLGVMSRPAWSDDVRFAGGDHVLCDMATSDAEHETGVPNELLTAISRVETGHRDPSSGAVSAWPWTINVEGQGHFYGSKDEAIEAVRAFQAAGARSIDVGCMQINLRQHPDAFASLSEAFNPETNALWAARFLIDLFHQTGSWPHAAAAYHSMTPELGADYQDQVLRMWAAGNGPPSALMGRAGNEGERGPPMAASSAGGSGAGSPFGADRVPLVTSRYDARGQRDAVSGQGGGGGRGLAAYRAMPILMANRPLVSARLRGS